MRRRPNVLIIIQGAIVAATAAAYLVNLGAGGFGNTFYAAAALASSKDPIAWLFGAWDAAGFITVDKPPLATMVMGISVRLLGLSPWSIMLPQAIAGVVAVAGLMAIVRRTAGDAAAVIAGVVMATTPVTALVFRYDNPDAVLVCLLVLAAAALLRGLEDGQVRWAILAAILLGFAFNTKFLQAFLALPAFALAWLLFAPGGLRRRAAALVTAGAVLVVAAGWWVGLVAVWPASARPYIGGSTTNSALELLLGYDGVTRLLHLSATDPNPGGVPGLLRLVNPQLGGQAAWLLPIAIAGFLGGLAARRGSGRTDLRRAATAFWGCWLLCHALVFSFMNGTIHPYYTVALVPAIAALAGSGVVDLWRAASRGVPLAAGLLAAAVASSAVLACGLLGRTPGALPMDPALVAWAGCGAAIVLLLPRPTGPWVRSLAAAVAVAALLAGPVTYTAATLGSVYTGGNPSAGPRLTAEEAATQPAPEPATGTGSAEVARQSVPLGFTTSGQDRYPDQVLLDFLTANRGATDWLVAVTSSDDDGPLELLSGEPVMAMGGFKGYDPAPTVEELADLTASGRLRFVIISGGRGEATAARDAWVTSSCAAVDFGEGLEGSGLYDCAAAGG